MAAELRPRLPAVARGGSRSRSRSRSRSWSRAGSAAVLKARGGPPPSRISPLLLSAAMDARARAKRYEKLDFLGEGQVSGPGPAAGPVPSRPRPILALSRLSRPSFLSPRSSPPCTKQGIRTPTRSWLLKRWVSACLPPRAVAVSFQCCTFRARSGWGSALSLSVAFSPSTPLQLPLIRRFSKKKGDLQSY